MASCDACRRSCDGRYVAFQSEASNLVPGDNNGWTDAFLKDRQTGLITRQHGQRRFASGRRVSGCATTRHGRYVAFANAASNLVPGDTNGVADIFVKDLLTGAVTRAEHRPLGSEANRELSSPAISGDGQYVAFPQSSLQPDPRFPLHQSRTSSKNLRTCTVSSTVDPAGKPAHNNLMHRP